MSVVTMKKEWTRIACLICLAVMVLLAQVHAAKERPQRAQKAKAGQARGNKQMQAIQKELKKTQQELDALKADVAKFASELGGFEKEPPCPNNVPDFYYYAETGSCYHLEPHDTFANWSEAKLICQRIHSEAHLVSIETEEEQQYLTNKWRNERGIGGLCRFWTSGKVMVGDWRWASSGVLLNDTYSNWLPVASHDDARFSCLAVFSNEAYFWGAVACWAPHMITCEMTP